ncbi:HAMP domain-containing sensor histidine kinase [Halobacteriovorax sp. GB3]|uniref:sensor histidine kinase n=1 Tax=Halobacteriovorax sp. GB3 TaxID=2719615 RepID=UPI002360366B|nr:HAMP domain-containing sensor histidine kinase [Halobacteriovorax sp. GB3]MDD0851804.1 HAMP domain-containing sensor histidine kinase [Halobacteriovorax sp. GB3]
MNANLTKLGEFEEVEMEDLYKDRLWSSTKSYIFKTYFACCFFFVWAGILGDYNRHFYIGSADILTSLRVILLLISIGFFIRYKDEATRPRNLEYWLDSMKGLSTLVIILLTIWTKGTSLTLLPGIMMMVGSFFLILPGRAISSILCGVALFITFLFFQDPEKTFGPKIHLYMSFMLLAIEILLLFFKVKFEGTRRREYFTQLSLKEVNLAKDKILATLAHDIRNPLMTILLRAERSLKRNKDNESLMKDQTAIVSSVKKLDLLITDLTDWALTEMSPGELVKRKSCVSQTIVDAVDFVEEVAQNKKLTFNVDIVPFEFDHDQKMLTTCVRNLLSNAIKFSPSENEIFVRGNVNKSAYVIEVEDRGPGMNEKLVQQIVQGKNIVSLDGSLGERGTGLGMKLVHNIVSRHGGEIEILSSLGKGSTFRLIMPI